ncbi:hypothetical protein GCWU000341_00351 [Oribacterium sp. oral taxon 078 str. F0262]|nr:hypothetical protein GCWU000341_00351 [Oribacterium sp. oral taxon 078 str. F0262]
MIDPIRDALFHLSFLPFPFPILCPVLCPFISFLRILIFAPPKGAAAVQPPLSS